MNRKQLFVFFQCILIFFIFGMTSAQAVSSSSKYILVYDRLYSYGEKTSRVLDLYISLKSAGNDVLLLQIESMEKEIIEKDSGVIVIASSFASEEKYKNIVAYYKNKGYDVDSFASSKKGHMVGINRVYPFSDLNKLMDLAENLNSRGIEFICTIMPVYENHELKSFAKFIEVLKYVQQQGAHFFIHYPLLNEDGTYNHDPKAGLEKAVNEYEKRGIQIEGLTLPTDALFMDTKAYRDLGLSFLLLEKGGKKIDSSLDLLKISQELGEYVLFTGVDQSDFRFFQGTNSEYINQLELIYFSLEDSIEKVDEFLTGLNTEKIAIKDFEPDSYPGEISREAIKLEDSTTVDNKTELDKFKEEELGKIKGENLEEEQDTIKRYDISIIGLIGVRIAGIIFFMLAIQVFISRRYDYRKFFKD